MRKFQPYLQGQQLLVPPSWEELIGENELVRMVDKVVREMDLSSVEESFVGGGRPAYDPEMMLKVLIFAYSRGVYSNRRIAQQLRENIQFKWLAAGQEPDFRTIGRYRSEYFREHLERIFAEVVLMLISSGHIRGHDYFLDGTTIEANAGKYSYVWRKNVQRHKARVEQRAKELFAEIDRLNAEEDEDYKEKDLPERGEDAKISSADIERTVRSIQKRMAKANKNKGEKPASKPRVKKAVKELSQLSSKLERYEEQEKILAGRNSYSKTDSDARFLLTKSGELRAAYNVQAAAENGFVIGFSVHQRGNDATNFIDHLRRRKRFGLPAPKNIVADSIYGTEENYAEIAKLGIGSFLKYPDYLRDIKGKQRWFPLADFSHDSQNDAYHCPNGRELKYSHTTERRGAHGYLLRAKIYKCISCAWCRLKSSCCKRKGKRRELAINSRLEKFKAVAKANLSTDKGIELRRRRGFEIETIFAETKHNRRFRRFSLRGFPKATAETALMFVSHNIKKLFNVTRLQPVPA